MRKTLQTLLTASAITTIAALALTGCTGTDDTPTAMDHGMPPLTESYEETLTPIVTFNSETGQIARYTARSGEVISSGEVVSSANSLSLPIAPNSFESKTGARVGDRHVQFESTLTVEERAMQVIAYASIYQTASLQADGNVEAAIELYNSEVAKPLSEDEQLPPEAEDWGWSLRDKLAQHLQQTLYAAIQSGAAPVAQFELDGPGDIRTDAQIAEAWHMGLSPESAVRGLGIRTNGETPHYDFACSTYPVKLVNQQELNDWLWSYLDPNIIAAEVTDTTVDVKPLATEPCGIFTVARDGNSETYSSDMNFVRENGIPFYAPR